MSALQHAQELYALASLMPTNSTYCAEAWCAGAGWARYTSSSIYDDLSLAASWLYVGTGECFVCSASQAVVCRLDHVSFACLCGNRLRAACMPQRLRLCMCGEPRGAMQELQDKELVPHS